MAVRRVGNGSGIPLRIFTFDPLDDERLHDVRGAAAPCEGGRGGAVIVARPSLEDLRARGGRGLFALGGVAHPRGAGGQCDGRVLEV